MKRYLVATVGALALVAAGIAVAQQAGPTGQAVGGSINATQFAANTDSAGFNDTSLTPALVVPAASTAQATFTATTGGLASGTIITTRTTMITTCSGTTGVTLPAVTKYVPIVIINRSGGSCLIWPSLGATIETAQGTDSAANASFTMLTNTTLTFKPVTATRWLQ